MRRFKCKACGLIINVEPYNRDLHIIEHTDPFGGSPTWSARAMATFICPVCGHENNQTLNRDLVANDIVELVYGKEYEKEW